MGVDDNAGHYLNFTHNNVAILLINTSDHLSSLIKIITNNQFIIILRKLYSAYSMVYMLKGISIFL